MDNNRKHRFKGILVTVLFHAAVVVLLIFLGFTTPLPLPGDEGVEVNIGSSNQGLGDIQRDKPQMEKKSTPPPQAQAKVDEEIVTQDTEEAPVI